MTTSNSPVKTSLSTTEHEARQLKLRRRFFFSFLLMIALTLVFLALNVCIGSVNISLNEVLHILKGTGQDDTFRDIVLEMRAPRAVATIILGGALALAGYLLQTFFHNPIAGPFVLGISSGAKLVVALVMVACLSMNIQTTSVAMILAAFIGSMISMAFVLMLSRVINQMNMLIVGGVMIGYICTAVTEFVVTFADDSNIVNLHNWSQGRFSGMTWDNVLVMGVTIAITSFIVFCMSKPISAYQMGESYARNMGVNIGVFRAMLVLLSSILSATVTAFAGPISFVGIAVPHLMKSLFGTVKPIIMIPACFLGGSVFCLVCDLIARVTFAPTELSISTVTAVFGAPVVIYIMVSRKR